MVSSVDINNYLPFVLSLLGGGVGVVVLAQVIKKVAGLNSDHVIHFMVMAVSGAAALAQYILTSRNLPVEVLGVSAPTIYGFSQAVYKESGYLKNLLGRVQIQLAPKQAAAVAADAAVAGVTAPSDAQLADIAPVAPEAPATPTEPAAAPSGEFNQ